MKKTQLLDCKKPNQTDREKETNNHQYEHFLKNGNIIEHSYMYQFAIIFLLYKEFTSMFSLETKMKRRQKSLHSSAPLWGKPTAATSGCISHVD